MGRVLHSTRFRVVVPVTRPRSDPGSVRFRPSLQAQRRVLGLDSVRLDEPPALRWFSPQVRGMPTELAMPLRQPQRRSARDSAPPAPAFAASHSARWSATADGASDSRWARPMEPAWAPRSAVF